MDPDAHLGVTEPLGCAGIVLLDAFPGRLEGPGGYGNTQFYLGKTVRRSHGDAGYGHFFGNLRDRRQVGKENVFGFGLPVGA